ncbi:MAG: Cys-Gln thioester bond-forming surface protein [Phycisphaerales bacterium]|nr:Cys-Gln thioester bond-forming surface protein [Phycisphaerales bacterium]
MNRFATLTALTVAACAGTTLADTINGTFTGVSPGQAVSVRLNSTDMNTQAGAFNFLRNAGNPGTLPGFSPSFQGFCIDLTEFVQANHAYEFQTYSLANAPTSDAGPMGAARAARLERLFAQRYTALATAANQGQAYAAFQLAVWEIVNDDGLNLETGPFRVNSASSGTQALAQSWLTGVNSGPGWNLVAIDDPANSTAPGRQGYVMAPTPGAAALFGAGLVSISRRRRD